MATIISGKEVSQQVQNCIKERIEILKTHHNVTPLLAIVQVGNREDSNVYIRAKIKLAQDVGMNAELHRLPPETTEKEVRTHSRVYTCSLLPVDVTLIMLFNHFFSPIATPIISSPSPSPSPPPSSSSSSRPLRQQLGRIKLVEKIEALNHDSSVHGIIVQLPFDCTTKINQDKITNVVSPDKDVDG